MEKLTPLEQEIADCIRTAAEAITEMLEYVADCDNKRAVQEAVTQIVLQSTLAISKAGLIVDEETDE